MLWCQRPDMIQHWCHWSKPFWNFNPRQFPSPEDLDSIYKDLNSIWFHLQKYPFPSFGSLWSGFNQHPRYQAIRDAAFETSACPVVITLENYLSPDGQRCAPSSVDPFDVLDTMKTIWNQRCSERKIGLTTRWNRFWNIFENNNGPKSLVHKSK